MDELAAYLPQDRARALALGGELPELCHGAALFADLSGFTPLTEALDRALGPRRGTEAMTEQINRVFATLITEVERFGGSVLGFAGDAITGWFDDSNGSAPTSAATCALALQEAMGPFAAIPLPGGASATLSLKVALASPRSAATICSTAAEAAGQPVVARRLRWFCSLARTMARAVARLQAGSLTRCICWRRRAAKREGPAERVA